MKSTSILHRWGKIVAVGSAWMCLSLSAPAQAAPPIWLPGGDVPLGTVILQIEELKETYLECDRLASVSFLDSATAANCSVAAEELRRVGFDGRGEAVLMWWKQMVAQRAMGNSPHKNKMASI